MGIEFLDKKFLLSLFCERKKIDRFRIEEIEYIVFHIIFIVAHDYLFSDAVEFFTFSLLFKNIFPTFLIVRFGALNLHISY